MSSSDSYSIELLNNSIIYIYRCILPVICILGNIGNLLTALVFAKKSWRKNVCVFYFNIVLVSNTCYINSTMVAAICIFGFNIQLQNSNVVLCKFYFYAAFLFSTLFPTILILASIDRLLISSQNVDTRLYSSKRLAYFSISISTIFWCIFFSHVLIEINIQELYPNYFLCYYDLSNSYYQFVSYSSLFLSCLFCFGIIVLCILAFKNVRHIRAIPRQQRQQIRTMTKKDFQLLRCLFIQDFLYIIFTIGFTIFTVYQAATIHQIRTPLEQALMDFFYKLFIILEYIPYCASFYIFVVVSKSFRNELKRMIYKIFGKDLVPIREEENKQENVFNVANPVVS
jgi:hypothetical protein